MGGTLTVREQQGETCDRESTADIINALGDLTEAHSLGTNVGMWEVEQGKTDKGNAVVDEGDPDSPSPGWVGSAGAKKLRVHD